MAVSRVAHRVAFAFLPKGMGYAVGVIVFPLDTHAAFCALQSRPHEIWARFFSSPLKDDLRYTPSDIFETPRLGNPPHLRSRRCHLSRRPCRPDDRERPGPDQNPQPLPRPRRTRPPRIHRLRQLHTAMDRAPLPAHSRPDLPTDCHPPRPRIRPGTPPGRRNPPSATAAPPPSATKPSPSPSPQPHPRRPRTPGRYPHPPTAANRATAPGTRPPP